MHEPKYFKSNGERELTHDVVNHLVGLSKTQYVPYAKIGFDEDTYLETKLATTDHAETG